MMLKMCLENAHVSSDKIIWLKKMFEKNILVEKNVVDVNVQHQFDANS